ncbi:MAG TPA: flagellar biosynthesis regulator FlaF [Sphingomonas sp.]|jgi:flagellar protein FlaF|nr:flagellar biosynthesis regulator FlaF [Sphingomonas sp.]
MSLNAYQRARTIVESPRAMECRLVRQITGDLIAAREQRLAGAQLTDILFRNRTMWNAFSDACGARGNMLPGPLRAQLISIGLWVGRYTSEVTAGREDIDALIDVNRSIIEGLEGNP